MASGPIAPSLNFQMRLPQTWNGKLHYGGSGYNGVIPGLSGYKLAILTLGYATVSSDSGHQLLWHGANDSALSSNATIEYFN